FLLVLVCPYVVSHGESLVCVCVSERVCAWEGADGIALRTGITADLDAMLGPQQFRGVANFSTFLLDRSSGVLFLGARDAILAVDTNNLAKQPRTIMWDVPEEKKRSCVAKGKTEGDCNNYIRLLEFLGDGQIYACGTYAFDPQCAFLNMSSFSLERWEDGRVRMETGKGKCPFEPSQHYTAVMADGILYTAATNPEFVSSAFIQQDEDTNPTGDDNKIYFFFTEVAKEYDLYTKVKVPRVARVCKSDVGGMKTLQRRWTTFVKAQLVCENRASGQRYNILTDVYTTQHTSGDPSSTHFYGLFTSQCKVMDGPFKELKKTCENWINPEPVPTPRPGQCLNSALRAKGFESSLKLPDKNSVIAAPLLVRRGITYTKVAVTRTTTGSDDDQSNAATVLHLGTDRGELHRVAVVGQNTTLLQEISLFTAQEPVNNILLHKGQALVGTQLSLARVGAEGCSLYSSCEECARARPLGCVWRGEEVEDALRLCESGEGRCSPAQREGASGGKEESPPCSFLLYVLSRRRGISQRHPDHSLSSEKGRDLLDSSATPQSPSSASLLSEGFPLTEKRMGNGTLLLTHHHNNGNSHHGNYGGGSGYGGNRGNAGYANTDPLNTPVMSATSTVAEGLKLHVQETVADEKRGGDRERGRPEGGEGGGEGDEEDEGLGEGLGGLEEELAGFVLFKLPAPLAQCEESSI
ncbi:unnamed protein product, partial [Coregonus sp. 'balchen']